MTPARLRSRRRAAVRAALLLAASMAGIALTVVPTGPPARAQQSGPPTSTTTTTSTTTAPTSTTSPSTTLPGATSTTTTTLPGATTTTTLPGDLFFDELVEPGGGYANQPPFDPNSTQVMQAELQRARLELRRAEERGRQALADTAAGRTRLADLKAQLLGQETEDQKLLRESQAAYALFVDRVADAYMRGNDSDLLALFESEDANEYGKRSVLLESVLEADDALFDRYMSSRDALSGELLSLHDQLVAATRHLKETRVVEKERKVEVVDATIEVKVWEAGSQIMARGFVFPVNGEVTFGDSWGAPRMPGTQYAHWHEGTDIMAAAGTPLVACEKGVVSRTSSSTLGGTSVYLRGESGVEYYYAHLSAYAPGVVAGLPVRVGDVLGYVGDTGNARGGSPHLHFEIHGPDGRAVNPYPILRVAHETQALFAAISPPG